MNYLSSPIANWIPSSNAEVIHMFLKIDALCPYMAHCLSFLPNYSGVAVRGALTYGSYFLSGEVETVLGSVLPQAISVDL